MSVRRRFKRFPWASWLAVFALLLQTLVPVVHHPAGMAFAGSIGLDDPKNICFAPGTPQNPPGDSDKSPAHPIQQCAICQALHAVGGFAPSAPQVLAVNRDCGAVAFTSATVSVPRRWANASAQPRGPPSLA
jgi:hypothetical protein